MSENFKKFSSISIETWISSEDIRGSGLVSRKLDFPALMDKLFEYNNLKLILNVAPCNPLPLARLYRHSTYDLINGAPVALQVSKDGKMDAGHFGYQPSNPFNPV